MQCEGCGEYVEPDEKNFECSDSGKSFHPDFGEYHWWEGEVICPFCGHKQYYADQSI